MKNKKIRLTGLFLIVNLTLVFGQFNIGGQLIQRAEVRNGFGKLLSKNDPIAAFVGQRARLTADYIIDSLSFHVSAQDVRIWGNASQLKTTDNNLSVYEAWGQIKLGNHLAAKVGRQELNYDNARFLGNVDWALQGRSHDFALIKFEKENLKLDVGAGYNQDAEFLTGTTFTTPNQYKTAQMVHFANQTGKFKYAFLFWNNGVQSKLSTTPTVVFGPLEFSQTIGIPELKYTINSNTSVSAYYYHQLGKDGLNNDLNAFDACISAQHKISLNAEKGQALHFTVGGELLSGTKSVGATQNNTFNPFYGTNHAHNGHMDYFYVGGRSAKNLGLQDLYLHVKYAASKSLFAQLDVHHFSIQSATKTYGKDLGVEFDFFMGYTYTKSVAFKAGYSQMLASNSMQYLQGVTNPKELQNWGYLMLILKPKK